MYDSMKKILKTLAIAFVISISFFSCELFDEEQVHNQTTQNVEKNDERPIDNNIIGQDSLPEDLAAKVNELTLELDKTKKEVNRLQNLINESKSPSFIPFLIFIIILIFFIALIIIYIKLGGKISYQDFDSMIGNKITNRVGNDLFNLSTRIRNLEHDVAYLGGSNNTSNDSVNSSGLDNRIAILEKKMYILEKKSLTHNSPESYTPVPMKTINKEEPKEYQMPSKIGYANINNKTYFMEVLNSSKETCVYKITFKTQDSGNFDLISLDKIKYRNGWDEVIDYEGDCSMEEASSYVLIEQGEIKKLEEGIWEVTKKLKIRVSK